MKVFISWSGPRSKAVAELIDWWLRCVVQAVEPWISTRDIDRGALWMNEISEGLKDTSIGIVCLTFENKDRPWILFETGALAKGLSKNRVCTFLIDLKASDLDDPLAQFNHTFPRQDSVRQLVQTVNAQLGEDALDPETLTTTFDTFWPQFEEEFNSALAAHPAGVAPPAKTVEQMFEEIIAATRSPRTVLVPAAPTSSRMSEREFIASHPKEYAQLQQLFSDGVGAFEARVALRGQGNDVPPMFAVRAHRRFKATGSVAMPNDSNEAPIGSTAPAPSLAPTPTPPPHPAVTPTLPRNSS